MIKVGQASCLSSNFLTGNRHGVLGLGSVLQPGMVLSEMGDRLDALSYCGAGLVLRERTEGNDLSD